MKLRQSVQADEAVDRGDGRRRSAASLQKVYGETTGNRHRSIHRSSSDAISISSSSSSRDEWTMRRAILSSVFLMSWVGDRLPRTGQPARRCPHCVFRLTNDVRRYAIVTSARIDNTHESLLSIGVSTQNHGRIVSIRQNTYMIPI